jgi:hypothetical protein
VWPSPASSDGGCKVTVLRLWWTSANLTPNPYMLGLSWDGMVCNDWTPRLYGLQEHCVKAGCLQCLNVTMRLCADKRCSEVAARVLVGKVRHAGGAQHSATLPPSHHMHRLAQSRPLSQSD